MNNLPTGQLRARWEIRKRYIIKETEESDIKSFLKTAQFLKNAKEGKLPNTDGKDIN